MAKALLINAGGGDSNLIGTAVPSDVLEGKTFYSDTDEILRLGTAKEITGGTTILDHNNTEYVINQESHTSGERIISTNIYNWLMYAWNKYLDGNFVEEVTSRYDNEYPDDGIQDNYHYLRLFTNVKQSISDYSWEELESLGNALALGRLSQLSLNNYYNIKMNDQKVKDNKTYTLIGFKTDYDSNYNPYGMVFQSDTGDKLYIGQSSLPIPRRELFFYTWQELDLLGTALARGDITNWILKKKFNIKIGDVKELTIGTETHDYRLIGLCQDVDLYNDSIGFTFELVDVMENDYSFSGDSWATSELILTLNNLNMDPSLKDHLPIVRKQEGSSFVWIMNKNEYDLYKYYHGKSDSYRIKNGLSYWLRSFVGPKTDIVNSSGSFATDLPSNSHKVALCFCLGPKKKPVIMDRIKIDNSATSLEVQYNG